jgi:CDP-glucose 4,6-dehydratase
MTLSSFWQDRPVLVTGATGLVGSWLVRRLLGLGAEIICLVRDWIPQSELVNSRLIEQVKVVRGDIRDQELLERTLGEYEIVSAFHLAAQTTVGVANRNPVSTFDVNIRGTWALLEACRRSPRVQQVVMASSDKAYGDQEVLPYNETTPLQGQHPYDVSKSCADLIGQTYVKTYGLPVAITRTIRSILRGERPVIRSDGSYVRDYFYVEDGAAAYTLLIEQLAARPELRGEAFNFSNELRITVLELVEKILAAMGSNLKPDVRNEASNETKSQYLDASKARQVLNWSPSFTLETGLQATICWYQQYFSIASDCRAEKEIER